MTMIEGGVFRKYTSFEEANLGVERMHSKLTVGLEKIPPQQL